MTAGFARDNDDIQTGSGQARTEPWKVLITDDNELVRNGIKTVLNTYPGEFEIIGEATNGKECQRMAWDLNPDIVIMDIRMPEMDGITATQELKSWSPQIPVMMLTTHADPEYFFKAITAGAADYVLKDADADEMIGKIRGVLRGENTLSREFADKFIPKLNEQQKTAVSQDDRPPFWIERTWAEGENIKGVLTKREQEVLQYISLGSTRNEEIANRLHISVSTVKNHVESIFRKLRVSDRTQAAMRGIALGYLDMPLPHELEVPREKVSRSG